MWGDLKKAKDLEKRIVRNSNYLQTLVRNVLYYHSFQLRTGSGGRILIGHHFYCGEVNIHLITLNDAWWKHETCKAPSLSWRYRTTEVKLLYNYWDIIRVDLICILLILLHNLSLRPARLNVASYFWGVSRHRGEKPP